MPVAATDRKARIRINRGGFVISPSIHPINRLSTNRAATVCDKLHSVFDKRQSIKSRYGSAQGKPSLSKGRIVGPDMAAVNILTYMRDPSASLGRVCGSSILCSDERRCQWRLDRWWIVSPLVIPPTDRQLAVGNGEVIITSVGYICMLKLTGLFIIFFAEVLNWNGFCYRRMNFITNDELVKIAYDLQKEKDDEFLKISRNAVVTNFAANINFRKREYLFNEVALRIIGCRNDTVSISYFIHDEGKEIISSGVYVIDHCGMVLSAASSSD
jgi:hypothetical protein